MDICTKINGIIEDGNISIKELSKRTGITRQQIARWKKGTSEPGANNLAQLCTVYGVSADYILGLPKGLSWPR